MDKTILAKVKKGEYIRLKDTPTAPVWIRGDYARGDKKYSIHKFDDVNHESLKKGSTVVYIGFTF